MKPIRTLSIHWESLSLNRRKSTRDTRWRLCSWLFSLVWFVLLKKTKLWEVPQRYQGRSDLGGGHVCVCVCVCVCIVFLGFLCWSISKLCPSHATLLHLLALYLFCLVYHLSCVLTDLCIFTALVTEKEDQKTSVGFESLHFRSELNLSLKFLNSFFHSDFYLIL